MPDCRAHSTGRSRWWSSLILAACSCLPLYAQGRYAYIAQYQFTGTSGKLTLQIPTTQTTTKVRLLELLISCPTATCTVTYTVGGGLATSTAGTRYRLRSSTPATSKALFFTASDATGGTALPAIPLAVGTTTLAVEDIELLPGEALSITVASSSQTITVMPKWEEY